MRGAWHMACTALPVRMRRGFTLVELLVVVVIVGVLATVGISLLRRYVFSTKTTEIAAMVQSIRAAQESWRAENHGYLDVSQTLETFYPMPTPDQKKWHWDQSGGNDYANWQLLNPTVTGPVQAGYAVKAGPPFTQMAAPSTKSKPTWPAAADQHEPWYVIQAAADTDGDGERAWFVAGSLNGEVYVENEGE
jgi:prepilin-type N-terminal cleavage/methylation domain-containing protein